METYIFRICKLKIYIQMLFPFLFLSIVEGCACITVYKLVVESTRYIFAGCHVLEHAKINIAFFGGALKFPFNVILMITDLYWFDFLSCSYKC